MGDVGEGGKKGKAVEDEPASELVAQGSAVVLSIEKSGTEGMEIGETVGYQGVVTSLVREDVKVTGHTVVETGMTEVTTEVDWVGQSLMLLGQLMTVTSSVAKTVEVVTAGKTSTKTTLVVYSSAEKVVSQQNAQKRKEGGSTHTDVQQEPFPEADQLWFSEHTMNQRWWEELMSLTISMLDSESCRHESGQSQDEVEKLHVERCRWSRIEQ